MLKPEKCFFYMVDYDWNADGSWQYSSLVDTTCSLSVPQPDGSSAEIAQVPITESKKTLGVWTNPAGDCDKQVEVITEKLGVWTDRLEMGKLPARWAWVSYFHQLWPRIGYGLGTNSSGVAELEAQEEEGGGLRKLYRRILPYLGVNRNIKAGWRHLHSSFGGIGLRKLLTETTIARLNLFLQHYNTPSTLGKKLTISLECLQLEAGLSSCPLLEPYHPLGPLTTPCWCRSLWECLDNYKFKIDIDYPTMKQPREGDDLLSTIFTRATSDSDELRSLQRCRNKHELIFLSDIVSADGRRIDKRYLAPPTDTPRSSLHFAEERPCSGDWATWAEFWGRFTHHGGHLHVPLGIWTAKGHRTWEWYYNELSDEVEQVVGDSIFYYARHNVGITTRGGQQYLLRTTSIATAIGLPCTVKILTDTSIAILDQGPALATEDTAPKQFWDLLRSWGGIWMWTNIVNEGDGLQWVVDAISKGTGTWVTDGSYNREVAPLISGAGWIFYCSTTKLRLYGSFYERSPKAGSYRGELLGLLVIHTLEAAIEQHFQPTTLHAKICCDNQGALFKSKEYRR